MPWLVAVVEGARGRGEARADLRHGGQRPVAKRRVEIVPGGGSYFLGHAGEAGDAE